MNRSQKGFVHIFLIVVAALMGIAAIGYFAYKSGQVKLSPEKASGSPTPEPTQIAIQKTTPIPNLYADWKTYKNQKYGFFLKYPEAWDLSNENPNGQSVYILPNNFHSLSEQEKFNSPSVNINVIISSENEIYTPQMFVNEAKAPGFDNKREIKTLRVDGHEAIQFMSSNSQVGIRDEINTVIATGQKNILILISVRTEGDTDPYIFPNQLLSTFKFSD